MGGGGHLVVGSITLVGAAEGSAAAACPEDRVAAGSHKLSCVWFLCKGLAYQH